MLLPSGRAVHCDLFAQCQCPISNHNSKCSKLTKTPSLAKYSSIKLDQCICDAIWSPTPNSKIPHTSGKSNITENFCWMVVGFLLPTYLYFQEVSSNWRNWCSIDGDIHVLLHAVCSCCFFWRHDRWHTSSSELRFGARILVRILAQILTLITPWWLTPRHLQAH